MKTPRRLIAAFAILAAFCGTPAAAAWPEKPIRLIWPFAAGGLGEQLARVMAQGLSEGLGQRVYVEAKPGGGGALALEQTKNSRPDGYTLLMVTNGMATVTPLLVKSMPDPLTEFEHIAMCFVGVNAIYVRADSPIQDFTQLRARAKSNAENLTYGSAGIGTSFHLMGELFNVLNQSKMVHVPYKGAGPAFTGLLAGETSVVFGDTSALEYVRAGNLRALAVLSDHRSASAPEIQTTAELGMPDLVLESFYGLFAPLGTPKDILQRLNQETATVLASPAIAQQLKVLTMEPARNASAAYFSERLKSETARWTPIVRAAGITAE
jgi:tripartite-type tricarboxylate transporter receptor subunit TctC